MTIYTKKTHRGFTLLYAVLVSSIVLAIGLGIFNIVYREIKLSALTRDSTTALYAADAGLECALYFEFRMNGFDKNNLSATTTRCAGIDIPITGSRGVDTTAWEFVFPVGLTGGASQSCAHVEVTKDNDSPNTSILASGRNDGGATCTPSSRTVERTFEATF